MELIRSIARTPWGAFFEKQLRPGEAYGWHRHDTSVVTLTLNGQFDEVFESGEQQIPRGDLQFKPAGIAHTTTAGAEGARILFVTFPAGGSDTRRDPRTVPAGLESAYMVAAARAAAAGSSEFARARVRKIMDSTEPTAARPHHWLDAVRGRIDANPQAMDTLDALAAGHDVHPVYLARAFRRRFGHSVGEYRAQRRVELATCRLMRGSESLVDIAMDVGFSDQSHFTRTFGAVTGTTPFRFRRSLR